ncbi:MAG TPA: hypothetical protein VFS15_20935 [Kofleriaceae bacterium]|nr:hypothetical protein [Kofleriaceae bacterium]
MIDDEVRAAWQRVTDAWAEPAEHDRFFHLVVKHQSFAWAAARYRERGDDAIAKTHLERLRKAALAALMVTAAKRPAQEKMPYRSSLIVLVCLLVALAVAIFVTTSIHDSHTPVTKPARH